MHARGLVVIIIIIVIVTMFADEYGLRRGKLSFSLHCMGTIYYIISTHSPSRSVSLDKFESNLLNMDL